MPLEGRVSDPDRILCFKGQRSSLAFLFPGSPKKQRGL